MVSPSCAFARAWRSEPSPLSAVLVTMIMASLLRRYLGPARATKQSEARQSRPPAARKRRRSRRMIDLHLIHYRTTSETPSPKSANGDVEKAQKVKQRRPKSCAILSVLLYVKIFSDKFGHGLPRFCI